MILSAQSIRRRIGLVEPFVERSVAFGMSYGLSPAGYDIRLARGVCLPPHSFMLGSSLERFDMPCDLLARIADKSTWARRGMAVQNTVIEPGWRGYLTLELSNHSNKRIDISAGCPIAQVLFELLDHPTDQPYEGKYQDQVFGPVGPLAERARSIPEEWGPEGW